MKPTTLKASDLMSLEQYAAARPEFRQRAMQARKARRLRLGGHFTLSFENRLTVQYQVQEMLRTERIFEPGGIEDELNSYNPLISGGHSLRATLLIEFPDPEERRQRLLQMPGIEHGFWLRVGDGDRITAIADEDMERSTEDKTSAVHFMRFELTAEDLRQLQAGQPMTAGVDYSDSAEAIAATEVPPQVRDALLSDLAAAEG